MTSNRRAAFMSGKEHREIRHVRDRRLPAAAPDKIGEAFGVERIVRQKVEPLPLHLAAVAAIETPHLQLQEYPRVPARQIAHLTDLAVVPARLHPTTAPARRFFERRFNAMMRAFGSPKIPRTVGCGRKPANEYVSQSRQWRLDARAIRKSCQISQPSKCRIPLQSPLFSRFQSQIAHSIPRRPILCCTRYCAGRKGLGDRFNLPSIFT